MLKLLNYSWLLIAGLAVGASAAEVKFRGEKLGNWWVVGETVGFKAATPLPGDTTAVVAEVVDTAGKEIARNKVPAAEFSVSGWNWKPTAPGYYTVRFLLQDAAGKLTPTSEPVKVRLNLGLDGYNKDTTVTVKAIGSVVPEPGTVVAHVYPTVWGTRNTSPESFQATIDAAAFNKSGWTWKIDKPGFYTIKFTLRDAGGTETPILTNRSFYAWQDSKNLSRRLVEMTFDKEEHRIAVLPSPTRAPDEIPEQVAVSVGWGMDGGKKTEEMLQISRNLGFNTVRIHAYYWAQLEPEPGKFNWSVYDHFIKTAQQKGFSRFNANPFGTPKWASTNPSDEIITIPVYLGYAPKEMSSWTNFLSTMVKRYPFIKTWELWNEPHLPGQSCFWHDTPENYVRLLKAGYETIKKEQPESTVLLGGIGLRYLPFYDRVLKLGAANYFDMLAEHGRHDCDPAEPVAFHAMERRNGVTPKRWTCTEWHAILIKGQKSVPEDVLAHDMVLDFMHKIRGGAEQIALFTPLDGNYVANKMLDWALEQHCGDFEPANGMFWSYPYTEPRLAALVWRNFIDCFSGKIVYRNGYSFANGEQSATLMESQNGPVLFFWTAGNKPEKIDPALAKAFASDSTLLDWEGRKLNANVGMELQPNQIYFLKHPAMSVVNGWTNKAQVLRRHGVKDESPQLDNSVNGGYRSGRIFTPEMMVVAPEKLLWHEANKYVAMDKKAAAPEGFAARYAVALHDEGMDLLVEVKDAKFHQPFNDQVWNGDSVQFAIDPQGRGLTEHRLEFAAALTPKGPLLRKQKAPALGGDLPTHFSLEGDPVGYSQIKYEAIPGGMVYKMFISRNDLYPFAYVNRQPVRFSLLVNNNDGSGRTGYVEWSSGIGDTKDAVQYGTLTIDIGNATLLTTTEITSPTPAVKVELDKVSGLVKAISSAGKNMPGGLVSRVIPVVSGARYKVSFLARGNIDLLGMATLQGKDKPQRLDLFSRTRLDVDTWQPFEKVFIIPENIDKLFITVFCWEQSGVFEIKDFRLEAFCR